MRSMIAGLLVTAGIAGIIGMFIVGGSSSPSRDASVTDTASNVTMVDGRQIVTINVRGGYQPQTTLAKPGVPTVIRFVTKNTFDCSSVIRIPSLGINKTLPTTGTTDVDVGKLATGTLQGMCGMGMYRFDIDVR